MSKLGHPHTTIPKLSWSDKIRLIKTMESDFGVTWNQQMEMAGQTAAEHCRTFLSKNRTKNPTALILAGHGFKAGIALTCARRLHAWGVNVRIWNTQAPPIPSEFTQCPLQSLQQMGVVALAAPKNAPTLILDGLGPHFDSEGADVESMVSWTNSQIAPVVCLEIPAGLNADSGKPLIPHPLRANHTLSFGLPCMGLLQDASRPFTGEVYLSDWGIPDAFWSRPHFSALSVKEGLFAENTILKIR